METKDLHWEHNTHDTYQEGCSTCFSEARLIRAYNIVNIPPVEKLPKNWSRDLMNKIIYGNDTSWYNK